MGVWQSVQSLCSERMWVDTSHVWAKSWWDVSLDFFTARQNMTVEIIVLRRSFVDTLFSILHNGWREQVAEWWFYEPGRHRRLATLPPLRNWEHTVGCDDVLGAAEYLFDVEARALQLQSRYPNIRFHEVYADDLYEIPDASLNLFDALRVTPSNVSGLKAAVERVVNNNKRWLAQGLHKSKDALHDFCVLASKIVHLQHLYSSEANVTLTHQSLPYYTSLHSSHSECRNHFGASGAVHPQTDVWVMDAPVSRGWRRC